MDRILTNQDFLTGIRCVRQLWYRKNGRSNGSASGDGALYAAYEGEQRERLANLHEEANAAGPDAGAGTNGAAGTDAGAGTGGGGQVAPAIALPGGFSARAQADDVWETNSGCGVSILRPVTSVKKTVVWEAAFIRHVFETSGVRVSETVLRYLSKAYRRTAHDGYGGLITEADLGNRVRALAEAVPRRLEDMAEALLLSEAELNKRVEPCGRRDCPACSQARFSEERLERQAENGEELSREKQIQLEVSRTGRPHIDRKAVETFLESLEYPVFFLDFEAYSEAIPTMDGVSPWEHIPVIYSLHRVVRPGAEPTHVAYAAQPRVDERAELFSHLSGQLGKEGSIVVYGKSFERRMIERLAGASGVECSQEIAARLVDLSGLFARCHYYRPEQRGSASLKAVYRAVAGEDYDALFISDGRQANVYYYFLRHGFPMAHDLDPSQVLEELKRYCSQDTEAMVRIVDHLKEIV